jgi:hypothetical protein
MHTIRFAKPGKKRFDNGRYGTILVEDAPMIDHRGLF